ncbi:hypothetical protein J7J90_00720 [Candidatus Micrarchaeota archaeon]|nr:hypothetical protein [Candidatus Micrarchaeota archaeon]
MERTNFTEKEKSILNNIFKIEKSTKVDGWWWWFWLFFIENPKDPTKREQIMVVWSTKNDNKISCNSLEMKLDNIIKAEKDVIVFDGAVTGWYFDGKEMHDDFLLEHTNITIDPTNHIISGGTNHKAEHKMENYEHIINIIKKDDSIKMQFKAVQNNFHPRTSPLFGKSTYPLGLSVRTTRLELMDLTGFIEKNGVKRKVNGTALFHKVQINLPPPAWYWGVFHSNDGDLLTYFNTYIGLTNLKKNIHDLKLGTPLISTTKSMNIYIRKENKLLIFDKLKIIPTILKDENCIHKVNGENETHTIEFTAYSYAHTCWIFKKHFGFLPIKSRFDYSEYPAYVKKIVITEKKTKKETIIKGAYGNIENAWGILI